MKKSLVVILLIIGVVCLFVQYQIIGALGVYLKTVGIVLTMFSVYKLSSLVSSKKEEEEEDSGNFKF